MPACPANVLTLKYCPLRVTRRSQPSRNTAPRMAIRRREAVCRSRLFGRGDTGSHRSQTLAMVRKCRAQASQSRASKTAQDRRGRIKNVGNCWETLPKSRENLGESPVISLTQALDFNVVRVEGLEPPRLAAPEPKSGASANFATPASDQRRPEPAAMDRRPS